MSLNIEQQKPVENGKPVVVVKTATANENEMSMPSAKLVIWNIEHGGQLRVDDILCAIRGHSPDLVVLTEYRTEPNGQRITTALSDMNLCNVLTPPCAGSANTVLIASRYPFENDTDAIDIPPELRKHAIAVTIRGITFLGAFCNEPVMGDHFLKLLNALTSRNQLIIAAGDFYHGPQGCNPMSYAEEFGRIRDAGWVDTWRRDTQDLNERSYRGRNGGVSRPDYLFALKETSNFVFNARFSQDELTAGFSDHAPLIAEIRFPVNG